MVFPSPLEVDRFLYNPRHPLMMLSLGLVSVPSRGRQVLIRKNFFKVEFELETFPSPLEVDRFLYTGEVKEITTGKFMFPSPSEVDRFLYVNKIIGPLMAHVSFRPLSRQIGSYTVSVVILIRCDAVVSVPSRGRQVLIHSNERSKEAVDYVVSVPSRGRQVAILMLKFVQSIYFSVSGHLRGRQVAIQSALGGQIMHYSFRPLSRQIGS